MEDLLKYYCVDWGGTVLGLYTMYLLGKKKRSGFIMAILADSCWLTFGFITQSYAVGVACTVSMILAVKGYIYWGKEDEAEMQAVPVEVSENTKE